MPSLERKIIVGSVIGGLAAGLLALPAVLPPALADEQPLHTLLSSKDQLFPVPFDTADLVKPDYTLEPQIATEVLSTSTVRKIGYGKTNFVRVVQTATGTYSSDGLASPHIRYPGIHANKRRHHATAGQLSIWATGTDWQVLRPQAAGSFVGVIQFEGGQLVIGDDGTCAVTGQAVYC